MAILPCADFLFLIIILFIPYIIFFPPCVISFPLPRVFLLAHFFQCASIARVTGLNAQRFPDAPKGVSNTRYQDNGYYNVLCYHRANCCL